MSDIYNEFRKDPEKWKDELVFRAISYSSIADNSYAITLMPLLLIFLYVRKQLKLVKNIKDGNEYDVLFHVHYINYGMTDLTYQEQKEYSNGVRNKALVASMCHDDPYYETVCFFIKEREKYLKNNTNDCFEFRRGFDLYACLEQVPIEWVVENYRYLFLTILEFNKYIEKKYMNSDFLKAKESYFELSKLMVKLLDIKGGIVVHPYADFGYSLLALPQTCSYSASFNTPLGMHIVKLLGTYGGKWNVVAEGDTIPKELPQYEFDYLLWNAWLHSEAEDEMRFKRFFELILYRAPVPNFKAACLIKNEFFLKPKQQPNLARFCLLNYIYKIVLFKNSFMLALFDGNIRKKEGKVIIVDETRLDYISAKQILQDIKEKRNHYILSDEEIENVNFFNLDFNAVIRNKNILNPIQGKKMISLSIFLTPVSKLEWGKPDNREIDSNKLSYSPYLPFISATDSGSISNEFDYTWNTDTLSFVITKKVLIVNIHNRYSYCPKIFDNSKGSVIFLEERYNEYTIFQINEEIVDAEYLVNEMNKNYFKEQLFPIDGYGSNNTIDSFLSLCIQVPDCETSLERQKNLYRAEKLKYIKELNKSLGYDIEKMSAYKERSPLPTGTMLLNGKYRIEYPIGNGGFGKTYKATEFINVGGRVLKSDIAIKEFFIHAYQKRASGTLMVETPCEKIEDISRAQKKFMNEVNKIKQFSDHPHIVNVYDVFDENGTCYYTMEYIEGGSLLEYVEQTETCSLQEQESLKIIREVASALSEMHKHRMNHLDVKPENILMNDEGKAVLIDFGAAHKFSNDDETSSLLAITSGGFSPLEIGQIKDFSPATDIYSLGATLYWLLTGEQPPRGGLSERDEKPICISDKIWKALCVTLRIRREERPQSIEEFLAMFD